MLVKSFKQFNTAGQPLTITEYPLTKRYSKLLVQFTIGALGIISIMLAQLANDQNNRLLEGTVKKVSQRVESLSQVSPLASQVNLLNILF